MNRLKKTALKDLLGELPLAAEVYWQLRTPGKPVTAKFALDRLQKELPVWRRQAEAACQALDETVGRKKVLVFATLRYWVEHATLLSLALSGMGHQVTFTFLPYAVWQKPFNRFDLRRQNAYAQGVLGLASPLVHIASLVERRPSGKALPNGLDEAIQQVALKDTQYTLQVEDVDLQGDLHRLRLERDRQAAWAAYRLMKASCPDVMVIPNGTILEFGALYQVARHLGIPLVTYEFGEQRQRIWLAQNAEVMRQDTGDLWRQRQEQPLSAEQLAQVRGLFSARQRASLWENFARRWQGVPSAGGEGVRADLGLDSRPVVLLATNVIGDSLTLGRQVFSDSMTEWLERTVRYFAARNDAQLVIRIHPGELVTKGPSVANVVSRALAGGDHSALPAHIHLVPADAKVNTYDIVEIADLGLVYTTTVGMEMVMSGVPVIAVGNTHYRGRGFTLDPASWEAYFELLSQVLEAPASYRPKHEQVEQAWNYAYRFFFEYPHVFPWHLLHFWEDLLEWPMERVLSPEGQEQFGPTFRYLVGEPIRWS